jgi:O-antigen/teichoic acid export membrane protein
VDQTRLGLRQVMRQTVGPRPRAEGFGLIGLGVGARFIGLAAGALAGLATTAVAVRLLGTASYGALAFVLAAAAIFAGIGRLGLDPAVARSVALLHSARDQVGMDRVARGAFTLVALTGLVGAGVTLAVIELASLGLDGGTRLVLGGFLGIVIYGSNAATIGAALARGAGRVALMELSILIPALGRLAAVGLLAAFDVADLRWVAAGYALGAVAGVAASWRAARVVLGKARVFLPDLAAARAMLVGSMPFAVTGLATIVISRFDVVILGLTGTRIEVGAYEPALKVVEQAMLLVTLLFIAQYLPVASRAFAGGDNAEFRELYVGVSKIAFVMAFPAVIVFAAFPEAILHALYGAGFPASARLVWILLPGFVVNLAFGLNSSALAAVGNRRALTRTGAIATAAMVVLALLLVPLFGATGAASATSATYVILNVVVAIELMRAAGVQPFRTDFVLTLLSSLGPLVAALAIRAWAGPVDLWQAVGSVVVLSIVWIALLFGVGVVRRDEIIRLLPAGR